MVWRTSDAVERNFSQPREARDAMRNAIRIPRFACEAARAQTGSAPSSSCHRDSDSETEFGEINFVSSDGLKTSYLQHLDLFRLAVDRSLQALDFLPQTVDVIRAFQFDFRTLLVQVFVLALEQFVVLLQRRIFLICVGDNLLLQLQVVLVLLLLVPFRLERPLERCKWTVEDSKLAAIGRCQLTIHIRGQSALLLLAMKLHLSETEILSR